MLMAGPAVNLERNNTELATIKSCVPFSSPATPGPLDAVDGSQQDRCRLLVRFTG